MTGGAPEAAPTCDRGQAKAVAAGSVPHFAWTIAATMLASSCLFIDGSVTNVALPAIDRDLSGGTADLPWIINA